MRKNGSRLISIKQYRFTDLFVFAVILTVFNLLAHYAPMLIPDGAMFTFTLTVPLVLLIIMRWGWYGAFFAAGDGLLYVALNNPSEWRSYLIYIIGNSFIMLMLLATKFIGKQKIAEKWYLSVLFVTAGWLLVFFGRAVVGACCGINFVSMLSAQLFELLSLFIAILLVLIFRRLDGMFEDQKQYLLRLEEEKKEKMRRDTFGDEPVEIDEESLSILKKHDGDGLY